MDIALNPDLGSNDLETFEGTAEEYSRFTSDLVDPITALHVLGHVADVAEICGPARRMLRPGGKCFVSVPDEERPIKPRDEILDFPPHHVSRWRIPQLERLGEAVGLTVEQIDQVPKTFPHRPESVPRPLPWTIAALYHGLRGGHLDIRNLLSHHDGDANLVEYRKPGA